MTTATTGDTYAFKLIKHILGVLFTAEERRHIKNCDKMVDRNSEVLGKPLDGFMYEGRFFRHTRVAAGAGIRTTLHLTLWHDMAELLRDRKQVEDDEAAIKQLLFKLLEPAVAVSSIQQIRDAVPDCILDTMPDEIRALHRCAQPESFLHHPRDLRQYDKVLPKIEFYSAARLLY